MSDQWSVPAWVGLTLVVVLLGLLLALGVAGVRGRARSRREYAAALADAAALRHQVDEIERRLAAGAAPSAGSAPEREYVITELSTGLSTGRGGPSADAGPGRSVVREPAPVVAAPVFADIVLRETVVQAASLAAGVRRALTPENRNRIRFEMRREVKRARKQRRLDDRAARRDWEARQRADEGSVA